MARSLSVDQAGFISRTLLAHWVQAEGWSQADLRNANGVQRA
ncbi:hypothetical protein HDA32_005744 [Spinactinospora alkalitolerans]|uniref:Uncharacterized protein n=1 Tax=Spinactinospora alkalitolerans TaxID=687207 RepID=A0A852U937_9ACTN|nr:hypothetical protein [Spinactinospora alkalitolerans]NYE50624.1 hypothetical protein [Spinactinospora alkalitolerans]